MLRSVRILLPWCDRREAVSAMLGFRLPLPSDDVATLERRYDEQVAAVQARAEFQDGPLLLEPLPEEIAGHGEGFLASLPPVARTRVRIGLIDLRHIISFQKVVALDQIGDRLGDVQAGDWAGLAQLCIPPGGQSEDLQGTYDRDGKGLTVTSLNPNLRVTTVQQLTRKLPSGESEQIVGFGITFGSTYVSVVEYRGRAFLKDGYHRCYGLLARGIHRVPCAFYTANSFSEVNSGGTSVIAQEHLQGPRPPVLPDFHDSTVSMNTEQRAFRKMVRIRAEEVVIHV